MSAYDVKIKRLALLLLPISLRKPLVAGLVQSAVQGCSILHGEFMRWRDQRNYRLRHNGQVCHLRAVLNDTFDKIERRITIDDDEALDGQGTTLYMRETDKHLLLSECNAGKSLIINRRGYGGANGLDFWISVPYDLMDKIDEVRLAAVVDAYKLVSKRWTINYN